MIPKADTVAKTKAGRPFDRIAASLIGTIAVIAALLAVVQAGQSHIGGRSQLMAARLASDISARSAASELAADFAGTATLQALRLGLAASSRELAASQAGDAAALAVGQADQEPRMRSKPRLPRRPLRTAVPHSTPTRPVS